MNTNYNIDDIREAIGIELLTKISGGVIHPAWNYYIEKEANKSRRTRRSKASVINDEMIENAKDIFQFDLRKKTYMYQHNGLWNLIIKSNIGTLAMRFNKLTSIKGGIRLASNNKTEQLSLFVNQGNLFGFPLTEIKLVAGYIPDREGLRIQSFIICTNDKNNNLGEIPITDYSEGYIRSVPVESPSIQIEQEIVFRKSNLIKTKPKKNEPRS